MASPLQTGKRSVNLAGSGARVSKIRRDPPPKVKEVTLADRDERDERRVVFGVIAFTLAIIVVVVGLGSWLGWSPRDYTAHM